MAEPQMVDPHDVVMTGENSFIRLSNDGGKTLTDRISHWRVLWSPAGQGHALFIESTLTGKGPRLYADHAGAQRAAFGQRRSRRREAFPAGPLRQARIELLPGLVGELDEAGKLGSYCRNCFTLSMPALTHSSSTPGEPDRPMPPTVSLPTLIGTPPLIAITLGSVVCSRRTGRVFISCRNASVVILNVRAV